MIDKFPKDKLGRLKEVIYEFEGRIIKVEWSKLKKVQIGVQLCLVDPDTGAHLSIIRIRDGEKHE